MTAGDLSTLESNWDRTRQTDTLVPLIERRGKLVENPGADISDVAEGREGNRSPWEFMPA
jgi:hypothetical protein